MSERRRWIEQATTSRLLATNETTFFSNLASLDSIRDVDSSEKQNPFTNSNTMRKSGGEAETPLKVSPTSLQRTSVSGLKYRLLHVL